jgi:uncharacterized protein YegP (UPF0339 family)
MDSEADIREMIERAMELDLAAYAVTDHCECNCWYPKEHYENTELFDYFNYKDDFEASLSAVTALKEEYKGFNLLCGTELGQPLADLEIAEKCIAEGKIEDNTLKNPVKQTNPKFEIYFDKAGLFRYRLFASNGESIAMSEMGYKSKNGCLGGIKSVAVNAKDAEIVDESI